VFFFEVKHSLAKHDRHIMQRTQISQVGESHEGYRQAERFRSVSSAYAIMLGVLEYWCRSQAPHWKM